MMADYLSILMAAQQRNPHMFPDGEFVEPFVEHDDDCDMHPCTCDEVWVELIHEGVRYRFDEHGEAHKIGKKNANR